MQTTATFAVTADWTMVIGSSDPKIANVLIKAPLAAGSASGLTGEASRVLQQKFPSPAQLQMASKAGTIIDWGPKKELTMTAYLAQEGDIISGTPSISVQPMMLGTEPVFIVNALDEGIYGESLPALWDATIVLIALMGIFALLLIILLHQEQFCNILGLLLSLLMVIIL